MIDVYLRDKITAHVAAVLEAYIENSDDVEFATEDVIEAIENEIAWAKAPK